jgi:hypothetical protein
MFHAMPAARRSSEEACTSRTRRCAAGADAGGRGHGDDEGERL